MFKLFRRKNLLVSSALIGIVTVSHDVAGNCKSTYVCARFERPGKTDYIKVGDDDDVIQLRGNQACLKPNNLTDVDNRFDIVDQGSHRDAAKGSACAHRTRCVDALMRASGAKHVASRRCHSKKTPHVRVPNVQNYVGNKSIGNELNAFNKP